MYLSGHHSLLVDAGILHRDISINNVMRSRNPDHHLRGFLIDLDLAHHGEKSSNDAFRTGTAPFIALDLLRRSNIQHTWLHDLESFFYVLIWVCVDNPMVKLKDWTGTREGFRTKYSMIFQEYDEIVGDFIPEWLPVQELVLEFRTILFPVAVSQETPAGEKAREEMYNKVISAFQRKIASLKLARKPI